MRRLIVLLLMVGLVALTGMAEVFVLRDGDEVEGEVVRTSADGRATIKMKTGVRTYDVSEFADETRAKHFADLKPSSERTEIIRGRAASSEAARPAEAVSQKPLAALVISGIVLLCVGGLWMTVAAFAESPIWGIAFLLSGGGAELAFMFLHWDRAKGPIITQAAGLGLLIAGIVMGQ